MSTSTHTPVEEIPTDRLCLAIVMGERLLKRAHWSGPSTRAQVEGRVREMIAEYERRYPQER